MDELVQRTQHVRVFRNVQKTNMVKLSCEMYRYSATNIIEFWNLIILGKHTSLKTHCK